MVSEFNIVRVKESFLCVLLCGNRCVLVGPIDGLHEHLVVRVDKEGNGLSHSPLHNFILGHKNTMWLHGIIIWYGEGLLNQSAH